jgi:hypothetical protein
MNGRLVAAAALSGMLAVTGCSGSSDDPPATQTSAPPDAPTESPGSRFTGTPAGVRVTELTAGPVGVADVDGKVWAVLTGTGQVRTGDDRHINVGTAPLRLVSTPDGVWVSVITDGRLVRIDPGTGKVDLRVRLSPAGSEPEGLAYDGTSVWVVDQAHDRIVPLDPSTGELGVPIKVGHHPRLVSSGPSGLWVGNYDGGSVSRVTDDGKVTTRTIGRCLTPQGLAEAAGVVWVACTVQDRLVGLDATTLEPVATFNGLDGADAVVARGDTIYAVGQHGPTVWTIDARTRSVVVKLVLDEVGATSENVDAALVGKSLVVSHPEVFNLYDVPLSLLTP